AAQPRAELAERLALCGRLLAHAQERDERARGLTDRRKVDHLRHWGRSVPRFRAPGTTRGDDRRTRAASRRPTPSRARRRKRSRARDVRTFPAGYRADPRTPAPPRARSAPACATDS